MRVVLQSSNTRIAEYCAVISSCKTVTLKMFDDIYRIKRKFILPRNTISVTRIQLRVGLPKRWQDQKRRAIKALEARAPPPQTVWRLWLIVNRTELTVSLCA